MPHETVRHPAAAVPTGTAAVAAGDPTDRRPAGRWPSEEERFTNRVTAGQELGAAVADRLKLTETTQTLVLGLPRGGVVVAREIAEGLSADLDVVVARKIGLPWRPEFGIGGVADDGPPLFDRNALACAGAALTALAPTVRRERLEIRRRQKHYRGDRPPVTVAGRTVVIADDGLTPGVVARAAVRAVRAGSPSRIVYAAPVCAAESADWLSTEADEVVNLYSPRVFHALGLWYRDLTPVTDDDVAAVLAAAWGTRPIEIS